MAAMPNLRIIYSNAADSSTVTASSTAGTLVAANMLNDRKVSVHRSVGTSVTYTLRWANPQRVGGVALPATNLSRHATVRVRLYEDPGMYSCVGDSGVREACPTSTLGLYDWGAPRDARAFPFGGASKVAVWFSAQPGTVTACTIELTDPDNEAGYIDCSRLVVGPYWEPEKNADYGASAGVSDLSKVQRSDSGDTMTLRGPMFETMRLQLSDLRESSRGNLAKIIRSAGTSRNLFYSLLPEAQVPVAPVSFGGAPLLSEDPVVELEVGGQPLLLQNGVVSIENPNSDILVSGDASAEQDHMIYGKRANSAFSFEYFDGFSLPIEIEGW